MKITNKTSYAVVAIATGGTSGKDDKDVRIPAGETVDVPVPFGDNLPREITIHSSLRNSSTILRVEKGQPAWLHDGGRGVVLRHEDDTRDFAVRFLMKENQNQLPGGSDGAVTW